MGHIEKERERVSECVCERQRKRDCHPHGFRGQAKEQKKTRETEKNMRGREGKRESEMSI